MGLRFPSPVTVETEIRVGPTPDHVKAATGCSSSPVALRAGARSRAADGGARALFLAFSPVFFLLPFFFARSFLHFQHRSCPAVVLSRPLPPSLFARSFSICFLFSHHFLARFPHLAVWLARPFPFAPSRLDFFPLDLSRQVFSLAPSRQAFPP